MNDKDEMMGKSNFISNQLIIGDTVYDVLFTFDSDETNKSYIAFTDNSQDENGNTQVIAKVYTIIGDNEIKFEEIETDKEWKIVEAVLDEIQEAINDPNNTDEQ